MLDTSFWEKYFKVYDFLNLIEPYKNLLEKVIDSIEIKKDDVILDAGSGTGNLSIKIKKMGCKVISIDFSEEALKLHLKKDDEANIFCYDLTEKLNFPENYFDKIVSVNVLCFLNRNKREKITQEFYKIIKPGGKIVLVNLLEGFQPIKIYLEHIKKCKNRTGIVSVIIQLFNFIIPTLKIFYYTNKIKKNTKQKQELFKYDEQKILLEIAGFKNISLGEKVYANQSILNSAIK